MLALTIALVASQQNPFLEPISAIGQIAPVRGTAFRDLDGDGLDDLVLGGRGTFVHMARAGGGLAPARAANYAALPLVEHVALGDINADGRLDLAFVRSTSPGFQLAVSIGSLGTAPDVSLVFDLGSDGDLDLAVVGAYEFRMAENATVSTLGVVTCSPANMNSTGRSARIRAFGDASPMSPVLTLQADRLPPGQFGIFAGSRTATSPTPLAGSAGLLCLGGAIGRYDESGRILGAGPSGRFQLSLDPERL